MTPPPPEARFFSALAEALAHRLGQGHTAVAPCRAAASGDATAVAEAQTALAALAQTDRAAVLADTHRRLATDLSAIWDLLPQARPGGRPN